MEAGGRGRGPLLVVVTAAGGLLVLLAGLFFLAPATSQSALNLRLKALALVVHGGSGPSLNSSSRPDGLPPTPSPGDEDTTAPLPGVPVYLDEDEDTPPPLPGVPDYFDVEAYQFLNPDVANLTEAEARQHYLQVGQREGHLSRRLPLFLTYDAFAGLCNQFFSHLVGLTLAYNLNATAITARAYSRTSFDTNGVDPEFREQLHETILDFEAWTAYWRRLGVNIVKSADTSSCVLVSFANPHGYHETLEFSTGPSPQNTLPELLAKFAARIATAVRPQLVANASAAPCVNIDVSNPALIIDLPRSRQYIPPMSPDAWPFAPAVVSIAEAVLSAIAQNHTTFWGVHLRIESDWKQRLDIGTTATGPMDAYINAMKSANFTNGTVVYFASAIFSYSQETVNELERKLQEHGVCGTMLYKQLLVAPEALEGLHSEQLALIDFIVLSRAERLLGDSRSTFSMFLREYRLLRGMPRETFFAVSPQDVYMEPITAFAQLP